MRHICLVFIALTICLTGCIHDNEPPLELNQPIALPVPKHPADADVNIYMSIVDHNRDWSE